MLRKAAIRDFQTGGILSPHAKSVYIWTDLMLRILVRSMDRARG